MHLPSSTYAPTLVNGCTYPRQQCTYPGLLFDWFTFYLLEQSLWTGFPDFQTTSSFGISGLWTCGHLNFWSSKLLDIWTSGLLDIWNSGLLDFKPSGLWNSGHLNFHSDPCPDWDILDLPCMLHKSQIPNVLPGHHHRVVAWASRFHKSCHALCLTVGNNWSHTCISFDNNCQSFAVITMIF